MLSLATYMYMYLNAQLFLEVDDLLFGESCDLRVLLVKVTSKGRVVNLEKKKQFGK